ncbi:helix-turn-helix domain-containing protein [Actinopolyspora sp. H202]|uniref:helix-turn-helix domain-containing protein n=1 Tax=Actinopolyspora sp. H202 TaxID=1500456 RepID=UPI003EE463DF
MANTPRARTLGKELRERREQRGLSLVSTGAAVGWSKAKVSRVERAETGITEADVSALLVALGVTGDEREQLLKMARELDQPAWWEANRGLPNVLTGLIDAEQRATRITEVAPQLVPGLLQTRAYTRAALETSQTDRIGEGIAVRLTRQEILEQDHPVELIVYLDETVLMRPVGGHGVMSEQLRYLEHAAKRSNITIRVLPLSLGIHGGVDGQFTVLELSNGDVNVHAEAINAGFILDSAEDVSPFRALLGRLDPQALSPTDSMQVIAEYAAQHDKQENQ